MKQTSAPPTGRIHMASIRNYNPSPRVRSEGGVFWVHGSYPYPIDEKRITNEQDLLAWVRHLSRKTWADRKLIGEFIDVVADVKDLDLRVVK